MTADMPQETLFPPMDPAEGPGEREEPMVLDDQRLPDASSWDLPESTVDSQVALAPQPTDRTPVVEEEPSVDVPPPVREGQDAPTRKRSAQDRINQLTARFRATQGENGQLAQEVAQLRQIVHEQTKALARHTFNPRPNGTGEASPTDPAALLGGGALRGDVDANAIEEAIQRAVAPIVQRVDSQGAAFQRRAVHEESFARATEEFPELASRGSEARRYFDELYRTHPLSQLDDGPEQIALLVRGVMASSRRDAQVTATRKRGAAVHSPSPSATDATPGLEAKRAEDTFKGAAKARRLGDDSFSTYKALRLAAASRARSNPR